MKTLTLGLAAALTMGTASATLAQYDDSYRQQMRDYRADQADYYAQNRDYEAQRREYDRRRADYEASRARYDRRYGYGAYVRRYGEFNYPAPAYAAGDYGAPVSAYYRDNPCERRGGNTNKTAGGVIGALAGAALGGSVAGNGAKTEGAVLGGVVGAIAGAAIGNNADKNARCDNTGYYFDYNQTVPYRETAEDRRLNNRRYDSAWSERNRCRLAAAPADWGGRTEYRYVRVCPDSQGRYRITG